MQLAREPETLPVTRFLRPRGRWQRLKLGPHAFYAPDQPPLFGRPRLIRAHGFFSDGTLVPVQVVRFKRSATRRSSITRRSTDSRTSSSAS